MLHSQLTFLLSLGKKNLIHLKVAVTCLEGITKDILNYFPPQVFVFL